LVAVPQDFGMPFALGSDVFWRRAKKSYSSTRPGLPACLLLALTFFFVPFLPKALAKSEGPLTKSQRLWDREVEYRLIHQKNSQRESDGEAYFQQEGQQKINYVVLNSAYFTKEAEQIFKRIQDSASDTPKPFYSAEALASLERLLLAGVDPQSPTAPELTGHLKDLQHRLEYQAWHGLFQEARANTPSIREAKKYFAGRFTEARLHTIEYHEASHLLDLKDGVDLNSEAFERFTELNAFYTELAYGSHPHDVMAHALSGLLEEWRQGRTVDYSIPKVAAVLAFLKKCPKWGKAQDPRPFSGPCLELLAQLKQADFIAVAKGLYQPDFPHSFQLASHP
jgi:hypothetical protein